ncbi:MAG: TIGR04219 family outer membrane beta-barrel protein [Sulfurimonadaceae bacterium]|jgi:outer membrane protein|nr:TIGR04219 family outer membrane beta-barrel protein [Sulfurimonadaceae bacterium]
MKKSIKTMACALLLVTTANADFLRVEAGAGAWMQKPKGGITADGASYTGSDISKEDSTTKGYVWVLFKHFVPVVPNLRLEYTEVENDGVANGTFKNFNALIAPSSLKMKQYDIIPYYNILDNTAWITLDVGLDIKVIDATYDLNHVVNLNTGGTSYSESKTIPLPLGYVRARVEVPATGFGVEADVKYITYSDNTAYDIRAKVDYTFDITPLIQPGIEVGYRVQKYKVDKLSDIKMDLDFAGFYAGAMVRF